MTERYSTFTLEILALADLSGIATYTNAPLLGVRGRQGLNSSEEGSFEFYASEADLLSDIEDNIGQVVTVYVTDQVASGAKMDLATFIIKRISTTTDDGVSVVTVSGRDITDQLRNTNAGDSAIDNGSGGVSTTDIDDIMNFASPGWSLTNETATAAGTYHAARGDTVLALLNAAAQQSGEIFRLATYVDPSSKGLYWGDAPDSSGVTLAMPTTYSQYNNSTTVGKLYSLRREFDFEPVVTRIRPFGAGVGDGRLDITGISSSNTGADPAWLDTTFASNLMVNATLETSLGYVIAQDIDFSWIQASDPTNATQMTTAAVALWKTAKNYLEQNDAAREFYTAVCNVAANIRPGQSIALVYAEYEGGPSGGTQTINDNVTLTVLSVENTFEDGERITTLTLGDKPLPQPTAAGWVADVAERTQATTRKSDVGTSPGSVSTGRTLNATQPVRIDGGAAADLSNDRTLSINGLSTVGSANQIPGTNSGGTAWEYKTVTPGTGISIGHSAGAITITNSSPGSSLAGLAYVTIGNTGSLSAERALTAGDGLDLTDGGANSTVTLAVDVTDFIDTSYGLTESSNNIRVNLAATSGLSFATGALQLDDTVAGAGLTIASKVLAVGAGDGIDVAADSVAVDVTDIIGNGLVEVATNNIALGTPSDLTATSTNAVTTTSHTHAIDSTIARSAITITAGAGLTGGGNLTANRTINVGAGNGITVNADDIALTTPGTLTVSTSNSSTGSHTHAITSSSAVSSATAVLLATDSNGRLQVQGFGVGAAASGTGVLDVSSKVYINETADANVTTGLVINQGTADNGIITLKSSEVAHGMTDLWETDTYGVFAKSGNGDTPLTGTDAGGLLILGLRDADGDAGRALVLAGYLGEAAATTVPLGTTGSSGVVQITAGVKSGAGGTTVADDGNMFSVSNFGVTRWVLKGDGRTYQSSGIFVNDTANANSIIGLTINQGANDDEIISLKSSDVAHGVTDTTETDTFGVITKAVAAEGGVFLRGYTEGSQGVRLSGVITTGDTTKSTAAVAAVVIQADKKSSATFGAMGSNENLVAIRDNASTRWIVDKEGDTHRDGSDNVFDTYQDAHLARAFDMVVSPGAVVDSEFDAWVQYGRDDLIAAGILHESGFYNESRLLRLAIGAVWQEYTERQRLTLRVRELEQRLLN